MMNLYKTFTADTEEDHASDSLLFPSPTGKVVSPTLSEHTTETSVSPTVSEHPTEPNVLSNSRPHRERQLPAKFQDYTGLPTHLINNATSHGQSHVSTVPDASRVTGQSTVLEPQHFKQVVQSNDWCEAMRIELAALEANGTW